MGRRALSCRPREIGHADHLAAPRREDARFVAEALERLVRHADFPAELRPDLSKVSRVFRSLADGGVPGLFLTYMLAILDRTEIGCRAKTPGHRGPMQSLADEVAAPLLHGGEWMPERHRRSSRSPLHRARHAAITGRYWSRYGEPWRADPCVDALLVELSQLASD